MKYKPGDTIIVIKNPTVKEGVKGTIMKTLPDDPQKLNLCISFPTYKGKLHTGGSASPVRGCEDSSCYWLFENQVKLSIPDWKKRLEETK